MQGTKAVIWDWNGTLLDDVECARRTMNVMLAERGLPVIPNTDVYRSVFGFPIRDFYARLGIGAGAASETAPHFEDAADRYLQLFSASVSEAALQPGARATLEGIRARGIRQVLISATLEPTLHHQLAPHGLDDRFDEIHGITDAYAASKTHVAATWLAASGLDPTHVVMIGDTGHDRDIADELGLRFVGFSRGHQTMASWRGRVIIDDLTRLPGML